MRQVTATEKYRAVNEGTMAKKEFVRQMRQQYPMYITQFNGYNDSVQILKNKGMIFEAAKPAFSGVKVYDDRPALTYSLDALDRGIRAELGVLGIDPAVHSVKKEDLDKATKKAKDNLEKDANHYLNLMAGESNKVDKHDKEKEVKRGALDKDTFNDMKKATLKENMHIDDKEWETEMGRTPEDTEKAIDQEASKMSEDAKKNLLGKVVGALRTKYPEITADIIKDFIKTHYQDLLDGADIEGEFEEYIYANYETASDFREGEEEEVELNTDADFEREQRNQLAGRTEAKGKDLDGDGDIDSDDYMTAKDKAIKKAMGKEEQLKEAIKSIIKKTLNEDVINEAATSRLSQKMEDFGGYNGAQNVINSLENIVTEVESFYGKVREKIQKVYDDMGNIENEDGLKIGQFIGPAIESAFMQDLRPVTKKGFTQDLQLPKAKQIDPEMLAQARAAGDIEEEPKYTIFTPVNESITEAQTDKLSDFGKNKLFPYLKKLGVDYKAGNGYVPREIHDVIRDKPAAKLAGLGYDSGSEGREYVYLVVNTKNKEILDSVIKYFNLKERENKQISIGWNTKDVKTNADNEITYQKSLNQGNMQLTLTRLGENSK